MPCSGGGTARLPPIPVPNGWPDATDRVAQGVLRAPFGLRDRLVPVCCGWLLCSPHCGILCLLAYPRWNSGGPLYIMVSRPCYVRLDTPPGHSVLHTVPAPWLEWLLCGVLAGLQECDLMVQERARNLHLLGVSISRSENIRLCNSLEL